MTKRSRREREQRTAQNKRIRAIEASMLSRIEPVTAQAFARLVAEARARGAGAATTGHAPRDRTASPSSGS